jgi:hypothetical protein
MKAGPTSCPTFQPLALSNDAGGDQSRIARQVGVMDDHRRWRVSIHEARHAVAGRLLGLSCGGASAVEPFAEAVFDCNCGERSIIALMGGAAGKTVVFGNCDQVGYSGPASNIKVAYRCPFFDTCTYKTTT